MNGKIIILAIAAISLFISGCTVDELFEAEYWGFYSPVATPAPDIEKVENNLNDWLRDYREKGKLW